MKFSEYKSGWSLEKWQQECPEFTYKKIRVEEIPDWMPSGLIENFNSAVIAASGNTGTYVGIIMGHRVDKDEIDEHPYVAAFDKEKNTVFSGFIDHGNWDGRTSPVPDEMKQLMEQSGIAANFRFDRLPIHDSGTLDDLQCQGILNGYIKSVDVVERKRRIRKRL